MFAADFTSIMQNLLTYSVRANNQTSVTFAGIFSCFAICCVPAPTSQFSHAHDEQSNSLPFLARNVRSRSVASAAAHDKFDNKNCLAWYSSDAQSFLPCFFFVRPELIPHKNKMKFNRSAGDGHSACMLMGIIWKKQSVVAHKSHDFWHMFTYS